MALTDTSQQSSPFEKVSEPLYKRRYNDASVLVCSIAGLDEVMYTCAADEQLLWLHDLHVQIDSLLKSIPALKIDVSGSCMMFASGVENEDIRHADNLVSLAKKLLNTTSKLRLPNGQQLQLQMGLHSGEVVSGVIGSLALRYSVYGPTVSVAKFLEEASAPGTLRLSAEAHRRLAHEESADRWARGPPLTLPDWTTLPTFVLQLDDPGSPSPAAPHYTPFVSGSAPETSTVPTPFRAPEQRWQPYDFTMCALLLLLSSVWCHAFFAGHLSVPVYAFVMAILVPTVVLIVALAVNLAVPSLYTHHRDVLLGMHRLLVGISVVWPPTAAVYAALPAHLNRWHASPSHELHTLLPGGLAPGVLSTVLLSGLNMLLPIYLPHQTLSSVLWASPVMFVVALAVGSKQGLQVLIAFLGGGVLVPSVLQYAGQQHEKAQLERQR